MSFFCGVLRGFLFWCCQRFIPLSNNRVVGSESLGRIAHFMSPSLGSVRGWYWTGFLGLPIGIVLGLPRCGLGQWLSAIPLIMAGWCTSVSRWSCRLACTPLQVPPFAVPLSFSSGIIRAPLPYRMVNAGLCDYKKKKILICLLPNLFVLRSVPSRMSSK